MLSFFVPVVFAASGVVINELMAHPDSGNDWVELYNGGDSTIDLSGWQLKDTGSIPMKTLSGTIVAKSYLVIEVNNRLNNGGDTVTLVDNVGKTIDVASYSADPGINKTIGRDPTSGNFGLLSQPTRGEANSSIQLQSSPTAQPTDTTSPSLPPTIGGQQTYASGVSLSEYLPAPSPGEDEWVELYNTTDSEANIAGWKIDDAEGGSTPFTVPNEGNSSFIPPKSYKVFIMATARFNNSGDSVRLLRPDGSVADETSYTNAQTNVAFAKNASGEWQMTTTLTPTQPNVITPPASVGSETKSPETTQKAAATTKSQASPTAVAAILGTSNASGTGYSGSIISNRQENNANDSLPMLSLFASASANKKPLVQAKNNLALTQTLPYIISGLVIAGAGLAFWFLKVHKRKEDAL